MAKFSFLPSLKVVSVEEMRRVERLSIIEGKREEAYMREAGKKIAEAALSQVKKRAKVAVLVGKGNKGGDGMVAALLLKEAGCDVRALCLYPPESVSPLQKKFREEFLRKKGKIESLSAREDFAKEDLLIDAIVAAGFKGNLSEEIERAVFLANRSKKDILAIDIPTGLDGTTGEVKSLAIQAKITVSLGLCKIGFFLREGWNHVGELCVENFGLPVAYAKLAKAFGYLSSMENMRELLPEMPRVRHKYQAGYLVGFSGSSLYQGAPKMAGLAALRAGAGIVRVFHLGEIGEAPPEVICQVWDEAVWQKEMKRASAVFMGPGLGDVAFLKKELKRCKKPLVLDADALQKGLVFPKGAVLTPHAGEMLRLLGLKKRPSEEKFLEKCRAFALKRGVVLVLKGAPSWVFSEKGECVVVPRGDPGMATAGTGDVLTGVIGALLAQKMRPFEAAVLGVTLHAIAGEKAAVEKTSYSEIATDLIGALPQAFLALEKGGKS